MRRSDPHPGLAFVMLGLMVVFICAFAVLLAGIVIAPSHGGEFGPLPDPAMTPGAINPDVTQDNIDSTICVKGWTKTIRPPEAYTNALKLKQLRNKGAVDMDPKDWEEDHLVSLEIGGHPSDPRNLWPEAYAGPWGARVKDKIENRLHREVCARRLSLRDAQEMISHDWIAAYKRYFPETAAH